MAWPFLECSRPALELYQKLEPGNIWLTASQAERFTDRSRRTVDRYLKELVDAHLILRLHRDAYATPRRPARSLLLGEPSGYHRSLLLYQDHLDHSPRRGWAFACLSVRETLDFDIPKAMPVFAFDNYLWDDDRDPPRANDAFHYNYDEDDVGSHSVSFPSDADHDDTPTQGPQPTELDIPTLQPELSLALLASTADPRIVSAVKTAADRLGLSPSNILDRAKALHPEDRPLQDPYPNTVVFPKWLQEFAETSERLHAAEYLEREGSLE